MFKFVLSECRDGHRCNKKDWTCITHFILAKERERDDKGLLQASSHAMQHSPAESDSNKLPIKSVPTSECQVGARLIKSYITSSQ